MSNPFTSIVVKPSYSKGNTIEWRLDPSVQLPQELTFIVELSETQDFKECFHTASVTNSFFYHDDTNTKRGHNLIIYYRVKFELDQVSYYSQSITNVIQDYNRRQFMLAAEIARKEYLRLSKLVGKPAALYKFRNYTVNQTDNSVDPVTGLALTSSSPDYGSTKKNGYYNYVWTYFSIESHQDQRQLAPDGTGLLEGTQAEARMAGFPTVETHDLLYEKEQDRCWIIKDRQAVFAPGTSLVVAQILHIALIPPTDPVYSLPTFTHKYEQTI